MNKESEWHFIEWDLSKISRFWNFASHWEPWHTDYFGFQVGAGIVNFIKYLSPLQGKILDFGCGLGDLSFHLLNTRIACEGVDSAIDSVNYTNKRFQGNPLWGMAKVSTSNELPYADNTLDFIFCIETIEHVVPEYIPVLLNEFRRVLKPSTGQLFVTAPHAEDLIKAQVFCPECGSVFHRYQHISSFSQESLSNLLQTNGFNVTLCNKTDFRYFQEPYIKPFRDWSISYFGELSRRLVATTIDVLLPQKTLAEGRHFNSLIGEGPHLFWIGTKGT